MGMFRHINDGWNYRGFKEFADLCKFYTCNQAVIAFVDFSGNDIPWELCQKAIPEMSRISKHQEFKTTGHYETMICLIDAMREAVKTKTALQVDL